MQDAAVYRILATHVSNTTAVISRHSCRYVELFIFVLREVFEKNAYSFFLYSKNFQHVFIKYHCKRAPIDCQGIQHFVKSFHSNSNYIRFGSKIKYDYPIMTFIGDTRRFLSEINK